MFLHHARYPAEARKVDPSQIEKREGRVPRLVIHRGCRSTSKGMAKS
ncbi:hypothetical protein Y88_1198 [Novosphingobium nitrogenifigens DSM 19370]|uniref:Uncharacterized protein n=1 Tax=Novosphingobium nitrogenifigens DSM 19370 TaxID=983920 RepID=F1Z888_9SPHN|nr:hypothetical protein Y88_1198 [Novosphingobium nitrogenifigens DSM 19370]